MSRCCVLMRDGESALSVNSVTSFNHDAQTNLKNFTNDRLGGGETSTGANNHDAGIQRIEA